MPSITKSVGKNGINLKSDVLAIQKALNKLKPPVASPALREDGIYGDNTETAIRKFQKDHVKMVNPDGRIDPGGRSNRMLTKLAGSGTLFPLRFKPNQSYKTGIRAFGSSRSNGRRKHAGVDLYAPKGTPVRAMKDGKVIASYPFYLGTAALEVDHGDATLRYGEISHVAAGIKPGAAVKRGQIIAYVGELVFRSGKKMSMLHLEAYKGTKTGPLTVRSAAPYQRRADLFDPTSLLDNATMK